MVEALDQIENASAKPSDEPIMINTGDDTKPKVPDAIKDSSSDSGENEDEYQETEMNSFGFFADSSDQVSKA